MILKTFEYVHLIPFVFNGCLDLILIHTTMFWGMTGCPSKLVPIGFELPLGGIYENLSSALIILTTFHLTTRSSIPFHWSGHWVGQSFKGFTLPYGKKGLKAQKVKEVGKR
jgi:hypothetical protein